MKTKEKYFEKEVLNVDSELTLNVMMTNCKMTTPVSLSEDELFSSPIFLLSNLMVAKLPTSSSSSSPSLKPSSHLVKKAPPILKEHTNKRANHLRRASTHEP